MLFGDYFQGVIFVDPSHPAMAVLQSHFESWLALGLHSVQTWPFWLALAGVVTAFVFYLVRPSVPAWCLSKFGRVHYVLEQKYFMDRINETVFAAGSRGLGGQLWKRADQGLIDGLVVNGSARLVAAVASVMRIGQSGYLYHYAIAMILGVALMLWWFAPVIYSTAGVAP
jgi:NADH-quinone oxidoreductase subunit L